MVMSYGDLYTINPEFFREIFEEITKNLEKSVMKKNENTEKTKVKKENVNQFIVPEEKIKETMEQKESVNHPSWYGSKDDPYETIKVIQAWGLNFPLGNAIKYISRAGKKDPTKTVEDLRKALFYIQYEIDRIERDGNRN